jgi:hypothetical protein
MVIEKKNYYRQLLKRERIPIISRHRAPMLIIIFLT